jgi:DNA end-binding protein Ku
MKRWCPHCDREVSKDELVKGYQRENGRFVLVEEEEISALRPQSTRVVEITDVVDVAAIDPVMVERSYFLAPDGKTPGASFAVLRDALGDHAAVGRLAIYGREYIVAVTRRDEALIMFTLRTKGEMRAASQIEELAYADVKPKAPELKLARQVLDSFKTDVDLRNFTDHYEQALKDMLHSKTAVEVAETEAAPNAKGRPRRVVNLMDALRQSLDEANKHHKTQKRRAKVLRHPASPRSRKRAS